MLPALPGLENIKNTLGLGTSASTPAFLPQGQEDIIGNITQKVLSFASSFFPGWKESPVAKAKEAITEGKGIVEAGKEFVKAIPGALTRPVSQEEIIGAAMGATLPIKEVGTKVITKIIPQKAISEAEQVIKKLEEKWFGGLTASANRETEIQLNLGRIAKKYNITKSELDNQVRYLPQKIEISELEKLYDLPPTKENLKRIAELQAMKEISETVGKETALIGKEPSQLPEAIPKQDITELPPVGQLPPEHIIPQLSKVSPLPPSILPTGGKAIGEEVSGAIDRFVEAIKTSVKPARKELEKLYQAERAKRTGAVAGIFEQGGGQKGYFQALSKLKGELAPAEKKAFEGVNLVEQDINSLFKAAQVNPALDVYEKLNTQTALTKVLGGIIPTNQELSLLEKTFGPKVIDAILSQRSLGQKILAGLGQIVNLPRTIMASFDLSAPFRQGLMLISHPKAFGKAFLSMFKQFGSEKAFNAVQESIARMPEYELMKQGKLALTNVERFMTGREEKFMASWAEKIPIVKYAVKASNRAYTGFLNKLRADVFVQIVKGAKGGGRELDDTLIKEIANFVNAASGRGSLGGLERGAVALNGIFFSPRLMVSRITFLNPWNYIKADPIIRKEMFKSLFTVLGSGMTLLGIAKMAGAKVGDDWRSSDFGKIIIGNTRIDIWGGFQQYVRMAGQLITGQYVSSTTGKITTLGEGYKPLTRFDIALRQVESKEAPVLSFFTNLLKQQDYAGKPIKITNEIAQRFIPMAIGDIFDIAKENPELLPASMLGIFGVGLQTYIPTPKVNFGGLKKTLPGRTTGGLPGLKSNLPGLPGL